MAAWAAAWLTGLALVGLQAVAAGAAGAAAAGAETEAFVPIDWASVNPGDAVHQRMVGAVRGLTETRGALAALLESRVSADAARESGVDVLLDLTEAFTSYANFLNRPPPIPAPQWQTIAGKSLDRIHGMRAEFTPAREDARLTFHRRGGAWFGPRIGMVSTKFGELYHLLGCGASGLRADEAGVRGGFALTSAQGDPRYDMHFSGEHCGAHLPEFRNHAVLGHAFWPDWWVGPRERLRPWEQRFSLAPGRRCGWILKAVMLAEETLPGVASAVRGEIYAWIEHGIVRRGYVSNLRDHDPKRNNPETALSLAGWSLKGQSLEAEIQAGQKQSFRLRCALAASEAGPFSGTVRAAGGTEEHVWGVRGTLYRAYVGTYDTEGLDGRWTQEALVGVAPAPEEAVRWPDLPEAVQAADLFWRAVELYRHVAAVDMAVREYPLPPADAMQAVREGLDNRWTYWHPGSWDVGRGWNRLASPSDDMHLAAAAATGNGAGGAADYVEALLQTAWQALADHKARAVMAVGVSDAADPQFAPGASAKRMESDAACGNRLPAAAAGEADWRLPADWTCFGFVPRGYSFETAPYLPEVMVAPGLRPGGQEIGRGKAIRVPHPAPQVHLWCWRADPDPADGAVTIPIEPLRAPGAERDTWGHAAEKPPASFRYLDGVLGAYATWYATTRLHADRPCRAWMAVRAGWDGRLWVNGSLVWRPARTHTPDRLAVVPVDLKAGENRITVCVSPRPTSDGNSGKQGPWIYKYGERSYGSFALWVSAGGGPRPAAEVAKAAEAQADADRRRAKQVAARGIRGRRGDGSGRYPDANPPLAWDLQKGVNVRWKAALPTDDAEPVIVGDRLFVTTYAGELACLDAATGKELWRRAPEVSGALPPYPPPAVAASFAPARRWKAGGTGRQAFPETISAGFPAYARSCLTPVAGARHVWLHDPRGRVACFDHDGRPVWAQAVPAQVPRFVCGGYVDYRVVPPTPPAMVGSRLVAAVGRGLAAFDAQRGTELWRRDPLDYSGHFAVMDFGDGPRQQLVLLSSCEVLDAATGKTLVARSAPLMPDSTCQPVVEGRVAYFNACSSAVRFWTDEKGDLRHQVLWDSPTDIRKRQADQNTGRFNGRADPDFFGQSTGAFPPTPVLHDGLLFVHLAEPNSIDHGPQNSLRLQTYDAATGCAVAQRYALLMNGMRPGSSTVVAGGYVFMADEGSDIGGHYPDFPKGVPMIAVATAEDRPRRIAQSRGLATLSPPVFDGRRIYLAGSDQVVCIERPEALGDKFSEYELAALKEGFFTLEIGRRPGVGEDIVVAPPADLTVGKDVPVVPLVSGKTPDRWLFAGPFAVDEKADVFSDQGGAGVVHPEAGQKVAYTAADGSPAEATFVLLDSPPVPSGDRGAGSKKALIDATYAAALGNARLEGGINFAVAAGRKYNTTCYAYTVLDVAQTGRYRVETIVGRIKNTDLYLAGRRVAAGDRVRLGRGRYPLMVRAAIAACGSWEPIEWAIQFRALPAGERAPPPRPITGPLPAGVRAPVAPLRIGGGLPPLLLGAWPLPVEGRDDLGAAVAALPGGVAGEGSAVALDGVKAEFRAVPAEVVVRGSGPADRHTFNVAQPAAGYGLDLKALFGDTLPARGLFFVVLESRRTVTVEISCPSHIRCWLSGREVRDAETVRLAPGLYPFLLECRATAETTGKPAALTFDEVADPELAAERWLARVRRNEALLQAIASSGPAGAYAREALEAIRREP